MKTIHFHSPPDGDIIENPSLGLLRALVLFVGEDYWCSGSGEALLEYNSEIIDSNIVIYYNSLHGFYLHYQSKGKDFHSKGAGNYTDEVKSYVGGNLKILPSIFYIDVEKTFSILKYYFDTGQFENEQDWILDELVDWDWEKYLI